MARRRLSTTTLVSRAAQAGPRPVRRRSRRHRPHRSRTRSLSAFRQRSLPGVFSTNRSATGVASVRLEDGCRSLPRTRYRTSCLVGVPIAAKMNTPPFVDCFDEWSTCCHSRRASVRGTPIGWRRHVVKTYPASPRQAAPRHAKLRPAMPRHAATSSACRTPVLKRRPAARSPSFVQHNFRRLAATCCGNVPCLAPPSRAKACQAPARHATPRRDTLRLPDARPQAASDSSITFSTSNLP